jgi:hypothetical protein
MTRPQLTEREQRYLQDLRRLPASIRSRVVGWAIELLPSIGLFSYGLVKESKLFLVAGFLSLLYFSVWRMYSQLSGFRMIQSRYQKQLSSAESKSA